MARRGFLSRIVNAVREFVAPRREPERERAPERRETPAPPRRRDEYRHIWREHNAKGNYQKQLAIFHSLIDPIEDDPDEREVLWDSYVRNMIKGEGRYRRQSTSNMFWRDSGIDPSDFDWAAWRAAYVKQVS